MSTTFARAAARLLVLPIATTVFLATPAPSHADHVLVTPEGKVVNDTPVATTTTLGERAVAKARTRAGSPYVYGATGPSAFDCSGLTQWVYGKLGKRLPRTSDAQAGAVRRVSRPRLGDLVFFHNGGNVYHVGIYAGRNTLWHASRPGHPVARERIWTSSVFYGRVR